MFSIRHAALVPFFALLCGLTAFTAAYTRARPAQQTVKLAVLVVFDQMRGDYLEKWKPLFGPDGFARLQTEGAWFRQCYYPYGTTTTGPGHASLGTGTCADRHGIVNNNWYDMRAGGEVYCASHPRYHVVPEPPRSRDASGAIKKEQPKPSGTPDRLLSETTADVLKRIFGSRAKVFGLSLKDRSAILPTGHLADGAYWFDGRFVTSSYYADRVHPWVEAFNAGRSAERWFGKPWSRLHDDFDYANFSGPDDRPGEGKGSSQGTSFPHSLTGGKAALGSSYYSALANSPFGNQLLLEFAKTCIRAENLGRHEAPDLLVVSFSSNDLIGHTWGPDSQEVLDVTLRSDALMADFLQFLDTRVGVGNYAMVVSADHGICALPEVSASRGLDAQRVEAPALLAKAEEHLRTLYHYPIEAAAPGVPARPAARWIESAPMPWLYLNPRFLAATRRKPEEVARALADFLLTQPGVFRTFTRKDLSGVIPNTDQIGQLVKRSYHPDCCGDVNVLLKPYYLFGKKTDTGTTHGTPHPYDRHVPLLVYGPGVAGGTKEELVAPQAAAAILARFLGVPPPRDADFPVPETLIVE